MLIVTALLLAGFAAALTTATEPVSEPTPASRAKRMIRGNDASIRAYPHAVSLERLGRHYCGGNIISEHHIVTACHCFDNEKRKELRVRAGSSYRERSGSLHHIDAVACHPNYDAQRISNDVAVARVREAFRLGKRRQLAKMLNDSEAIGPDDNATVAGWGYVSGLETQLATKLQTMDLRIVNTSACAEDYVPWIRLSPGQMCAEKDYTSGPCRGDSGGGLMVDGLLVGLLSFSANECDFHMLPAVFTEVAYFHDWIVEKVKNMGPVDRGIAGWLCDVIWCPSFLGI